jgi:hypothetical protein
MSNYSHDTPPPTIIDDGSLAIKLSDDLTLPATAENGRWIHKGPADTPIAHIKVLHGSGDMVYRNLDAGDSRITVELEDMNHDPVGNLIITGGEFFQIDSDQLLMRQGVSGAPRRHTFAHPGAGQNLFRVKSIEILRTANPSAQFRVTAPRTTQESQEYRIMIWHSPDQVA